MGTTQEYYILFWTNSGSNTPQNSSCMTTYFLSPKTIQIRQTKHVGHYCRSKDELISNILLWTLIGLGIGIEKESGKSMLSVWLDDVVSKSCPWSEILEKVAQSWRLVCWTCTILCFNKMFLAKHINWLNDFFSELAWLSRHLD